MSVQRPETSTGGSGGTTPEPDTIFGREPARVIGAVGAVVSAVITLLVALGVAVPEGLDDQLQDLIQGIGYVITIAIPLWVGNRTRKEVTPVAKLRQTEEGRQYLRKVA